MGAKDFLTIDRLLGNAQKFSDKQIGETLALLVESGAKQGTSAIHIEPHDRFVLVRYRIDGALRGIHKLPRTALRPIMKQLKLLADLSPGESTAPQEGHYALELGDKAIGVRVALMPVLGGEKAVLHLSTAQDAPGSLESLGFWGTNLDTLHEALSRPHGLITVGGTKHGGKTTTLYALLRLLHNPAYSLATIEEHATQRLPGVSQTYVHQRTGTTMLEGLQAVLRQDPNVIMLGSLPNAAVAELAVQSAVTGHLVLAEVYVYGAVAGLARLRAMGVEPFLLATAWRISIGQRLVRRICPSCRVQYQPSPEELQRIEARFGLSKVNNARLHQLEVAAQAAGYGTNLPLSTTAAGITHLWKAKEGGCSICDHTGYKGRVALTEVLSNSENMQKQIMKQPAATTAELHRAALKDGFIPLGLDGLAKALRGETTLAEVLRAAEPTGV